MKNWTNHKTNWWLGPLNFWILQWGFCRLCAIYDVNSLQKIGWKMWFPVAPLTRWNWRKNNYA